MSYIMLSGVLNASVEKSPANDCTSGQSLILTQLSMTLIIFVPLLLCFIKSTTLQTATPHI
jgi:hypothetical protein